MMPKLSSPLQFYVKHAADVGALWAESEKPDEVKPEEWALFQDVLEELKSDADALVRRLASPLDDGAIAGFSVIGKRPYKVRENWDYYRQYKPVGKGNRGPAGHAGIQIVDEPGGKSFFVVYVRALSFSRPQAPEGFGERCPDELKNVLTDKLVVAGVQLTTDTDEESLLEMVIKSSPDIIAILGSLSG